MSNDEELKTWHVTQILFGSKIETRIVKALTQAAAEGDLFDGGELQDQPFDLAAAKALSKHEGQINGMDPKEWVASLRQ